MIVTKSRRAKNKDNEEGIKIVSRWLYKEMTYYMFTKINVL